MYIPSAIQVKHQWKTVGIEQKLDVISWLENGEWIVPICFNVRFAHSNICMMHDNDDRNTESATSETKVFV